MPVPLGLFGISFEEILNSLSPYGEIVLWCIIFAETGLLIGFLLPGDSLLFAAGVLAGQGKLDITMVVIGCFVAAVVGDQVGFTIGQRLGPRLFSRPNSRFFKQEYVERTKGFFERHGPRTIVMARFLPFVRTFAPTMAGVGDMSRRLFLTYNVIGALIWAVGITMLGYVLGDAIGADIDLYILPLVGFIVLMSILPVAIEYRHNRKVRNIPDTPAEAEIETHELERLLHDD